MLVLVTFYPTVLMKVNPKCLWLCCDEIKDKVCVAVLFVVVSPINRIPYTGKIRRALNLVNWSQKGIGYFKCGELKKSLTKYRIWVWLRGGSFLVLHGEH